MKKNNIDSGVSCLLIGDKSLGQLLSEDNNINLLSATGSTKMGKDVAMRVGKRLGKTLLELGGNNAMIITENADIKHAINNLVFGAIGTSGQRCTSTRRVIVHSTIFDHIKKRINKSI